jgi:hypothetical protein
MFYVEYNMEKEIVTLWHETGRKNSIPFKCILQFRYNDGGRSDAGYKGDTSDCVTRAIAIVTGKPYQEVYDALNQLGKSERLGSKKKKKSNSRTGVYRITFDKYLKSLGYVWTPTMKIGSGCMVHLRPDELPGGRLVVRVSRHVTAMIDGVLNDLCDHTRRGTRCVYGYYHKPENKDNIE